MKSRKKKSRWTPFGGILAFLAVAGGKLKFLLPLLKLGKIGGTIWSMALMIGAYALIYPWTFAVGVAIMIFIHEMGHVIAAKRKGIPVSAPAFIPFMGALITLKKQPVDAATEAYLAFGGPFIGSLGALVTFFLAYFFNSPALLSIAQVGFFLNLINLIPIHPLDGGRIVTAISRWLWVIGLVGGLFVIIYLQALLFLIFWGLFAWELYKKFVRKNDSDPSWQQTGLVIEAKRLHFEESGLPIPAESHQRELPFSQACDRLTQEEYCNLYYPGIGLLSRVPFPYGLIHKVRLIGTEQESEVIRMKLQINYMVYPEYQSSIVKQEEYYQVSSRTRWIFGISYAGLAAFLSWMMFEVHSIFPSIPL
ncbi:MAG TPA: site-2 protease family protein [Bacillota bacterium]|nr:site-2 protease family protein [Bacillota bacterium]